jgi:uncharacterized protein (TIGR03067 family)
MKSNIRLSSPIIVLTALLALCSMTFAEQKNALSKEQTLEKLQGDWICIAQELAGKDMSASDVKLMNRRLTVKGTKLVMSRVMKEAFGKYEGRFDVNPTVTPCELDLTGKNPSGAYIEKIGIYELNGDTLRLCWGDPKVNSKRPEKFETAPGAGREYFTFKRDKE